MSSGGSYENKSVNIKFIYILSVNIFFLFQATPVNTNIQVIDASGTGYMVGILIQLTIWTGYMVGILIQLTIWTGYMVGILIQLTIWTGYMVGILIQLTISGFAWYTAFKYMFLFNLRHYICFYCKSNLRNGFLMPHLYETSGIVCVCMSLGSKVMEIINFRNSRMTKSKMAAKWTPMGQ